MFIQYISTSPFFYFSWVFLAAFSICCHEFAHAYTASKVGDDTAERNGHLTLNPLVQMGPQSLIMLVLFGIAWGAVPVTLSNVSRARDRAMISFAGPLANLLLCIVFSLLSTVAGITGAESIASTLYIGGAVNGMLFVLNILPVPVLDGFAIISAFNYRLEEFAQKYASAVFVIFIILLWNTQLGDTIFRAGTYIQNTFMMLFQNLLSAFI